MPHETALRCNHSNKPRIVRTCGKAVMKSCALAAFAAATTSTMSASGRP